MLKRPAAVLACLSVLLLAGCGNEADGDDTATDNTSQTPAAGRTTTCDYPADGQEAAREVEVPDSEAQAEGNDNANPAGGGAPNKDVTIEKVTVG